MKQKLFYLQCAAIGLMILGVAGLGVILFRKGEINMAAMYVFAALGFAGFAGNAVLAVIRVLWEKGGRQ